MNNKSLIVIFLVNMVLVVTLLLHGCSAALIERLSTEKFVGKETEPFVTEYAAGTSDNFGIRKWLIISNPLDMGIKASIACKSMYQEDLWLHVNAKSNRFVLISAPTNWEDWPSCALSHYSADNSVQ